METIIVITVATGVAVAIVAVSLRNLGARPEDYLEILEAHRSHILQELLYLVRNTISM